MKKRTWGYVGVSAFWLMWPVLYWYLRGSRRSRILLVCDGKVLVVRNWLGAGKWTLPGGGTHAGEDSATGAIRELTEETGVVLEPNDLKLLGTFKQSEHGFKFSYDVFIAHPKTKPLVTVQKKEISDFAWVDPRELTPRNSSKEVLDTLAAWV